MHKIRNGLITALRITSLLSLETYLINESLIHLNRRSYLFPNYAMMVIHSCLFHFVCVIYFLLQGHAFQLLEFDSIRVHMRFGGF